MPAFRLTETPWIVQRFDVLGQHSKTKHGFVKHVALFDDDDREVRHDCEVTAIHMGPPLEQVTAMRTNVVGSVPLTNDERKRIALWVERVKDEYEAAGVVGKSGILRQYVIDPPWEDQPDKRTGIRRYRRYSCAGFVFDAYQRIGIELVELDRAQLPEVAWEVVESVYEISNDRRGLLTKFGLHGDGPWRILLPGFILHALNRPTEDIRKQPYRANNGDERF